MREILFRGFHEDANGIEKAFYGGKWHNGWWIVGNFIVTKCKVGDTVYQIDKLRIYESIITAVLYDTNTICFDSNAIGSTIYLTREEAEKALKIVNGDQK